MELYYWEFLGFLMSHSFTVVTTSKFTSEHTTQKPQCMGGCHVQVQTLPILTVDWDESHNSLYVVISLF